MSHEPHPLVPAYAGTQTVKVANLAGCSLFLPGIPMDIMNGRSRESWVPACAGTSG